MAAIAHSAKVSIEIHELASVRSLTSSRVWRQIRAQGDSLFARGFLAQLAIYRSEPLQAKEQDGDQIEDEFLHQLRVDPAGQHHPPREVLHPPRVRYVAPVVPTRSTNTGHSEEYIRLQLAPIFAG